MRKPRFVFLAMNTPVPSGEPGTESVSWMLVSSNNRRLGQAAYESPTYELCRELVWWLREEYLGLAPVLTAGPTGRWAWRLELGGTRVAVSTRSYLRQLECEYNVRCFLEAVPEADVTPVARTVRMGELSRRVSGPFHRERSRNPASGYASAGGMPVP